MHHLSRTRLGFVFAMALAGGAVIACTEAGTSPSAIRPAFISSGGDGVLAPQEFEVCKFGSDGNFEGVAKDKNTGAVLSTFQASLTDGDCQVVFAFSGQPFNDVQVTLTEIPTPGFVLDHIDATFCIGANVTTPCTPQPATVNGATASGPVGLESGTLAKFYNVPLPPPPQGGQGCTPGYWKQSQHFHSWTSPYTPNMLFKDAGFDDAFPGKTLLQVASTGGNSAAEALGRHAVAALLNAASPDVSYDLSVASVIAQFNAVFPGSKNDYNALKDQFEAFNEQGCPLN